MDSQDTSLLGLTEPDVKGDMSQPETTYINATDNVNTADLELVNDAKKITADTKNAAEVKENTGDSKEICDTKNEKDIDLLQLTVDTDSDLDSEEDISRCMTSDISKREPRNHDCDSRKASDIVNDTAVEHKAVNSVRPTVNSITGEEKISEDLGTPISERSLVSEILECHSDSEEDIGELVAPMVVNGNDLGKLDPANNSGEKEDPEKEQALADQSEDVLKKSTYYIIK